jgi:hypothetical protein
MSDDIVERLKVLCDPRAECLSDGTRITQFVKYGTDARHEITRLRADLAAVTAEQDKMREALKPLAAITLWTDKYPDGPLSVGDNQRYIDPQWIVRARAALEGVTRKSGAENE